MAVFTNTIVIQAVDKASNALKSIGSLFNITNQQAQNMGKAVPNSIQGMFNPIQSMSNLLNTNMTQINRGTNATFAAFSHNVRNQINKFNSIIMGGVALSMSGLGIERVGQAGLRAINGWVDAAMDFEKVMRQIKFLGNLNDEQYKMLDSTIIRLGIDLPGSNLDVANGVLEALKTGYSADEANKLARPISILSFLSEGMMDTAETAQFLNNIMVQTGKSVDDSSYIMDRLTKTADLSAFSVGELKTAWESSRAGLGNLNTDMETMLTLLGVARTSLSARYAGNVVNAFSRSLLQANNAADQKGKKGDLWRALGINLDETKDPIEILKMVSERSKALWGNETAEQRGNLVTLFGSAALPIFQAYDRFAKNGKLSMEQMRDELRNSTGYAEQYTNEMMNTTWAVREVFNGTVETLRQTMGELFGPVLVPFMKVMQSVLGAMTTFIRDNPTIGKFFAIVTLAGATLMTVGGAAAMVLGQMMSIYGTVLNTVLQFTTIGITSSQALANLSQNGATLGQLLRAQIGGPLGQIRGQLFRLGIYATLFFMAWKYDFLKLRTVTTEFFKNMRESVDKAHTAFQKMDPKNLGLFTSDLFKGTIWERITGLVINFTAVFDALNTAIGNFHKLGAFRISDRQFQILNELGLIKTVNWLLSAYYASTRFFTGFYNGSKKAFAVLNILLFKPLKFVVGLLYQAFILVGKVLGFARDLGRPNADFFEGMGEKFGVVLGAVMAVKLAIRSWVFLLRDVRTIAGGIGKAFGWLFGRGGGGGAAGGGGGSLLQRVRSLNASNAVNGASSAGGRFINWMTGNSNASTKLGTGIAPYLQRAKNFFLRSSSNAGLPMGLIPRVRGVNWAGGKLPTGVHPLSGVTIRNQGLFGPILERLFGAPVYAHNGGQLLGRTQGLFTGLGQRFNAAGLANNAGRLGAIMKRVPWLAAAATGLTMWKAGEGNRVNAGTKTAMSFAGGAVGAKIGGAIGTLIAPGIGTTIGSVLGSLLGGFLITPLSNWLAPKLQTLWNNISSGFSGAIQGALAWVNRFLNDVPGNIGYAIGYGIGLIQRFFSEFLPWALENIGTGIGKMITWVVDGIANIGTNVIDFFKSLPEKVTTVFEDFSKKWVEFWDNFHPIESAKTAIKNFFGGAGSGYKAATNGSTGGNTTTQTVTGMGRITENARGGLITGPILTTAGEDGEEVIIPLSQKYRDRATSMMGMVGERLGLGGSSAPSQPTVNSTSVTFAPGSVVIQGGDMSDPAVIRRGAEEMFKQFKAMVEREQMRNYQPVRVR